MATAGSMRETVKALTTTFSAQNPPTPLPDELQHTIDAFLERYRDAEEHDAQRFHEDLLSLYMRHVVGHPEKHSPFLQALRRVRPALTGQARLNEWWGLVIKPTVDKIGCKRKDIEEASGLLLDILAYDADEDKDGERARLSKFFSKILLDAYLARTKLPTGEGDTISHEDDFVSHELEAILVKFGRQKPKDFLLALDHLFVQKLYRVQVLNLLSAYVRLQPPHLYRVLETPLIEHLEKCLLIDTSSTVIELALMILIMFLPHITSSLTSEVHLGKLFLIYSRILCWDKFASPAQMNNGNNGSEEHEDSDLQHALEDIDETWEKLEHSSDYPDSTSPTILHFFTFLYGLFPLNFMSFLRKPRKYLKSHNFPDAEDFDLDQDLIHSRTEPYRRVHLLHPNMFRTTIEDELADNPWLKSDPADIVTECMDLCVAVSTTLDDPGPPPTSELPAIPLPPVPDIPTEAETSNDETGANNAQDATASWRNTQSTMFGSSTPGQPDTSEDIAPKSKSAPSSRSASPLLKAIDPVDSPTLPPVKEPQLIGASLTSPQHLDAPSHRLGDFAQAVTTGTSSPINSEYQNQSTASLQREIMLLRNDLNFERYLKQQHLTHIGQLQRRHIKEATDAAETQNLINANRTLKARLAKANELYAQLKKETLTSRSQSKKWEGELSSKVKSYREEQKNWQSEEDQLRYELKKSQQDCEHLKRMVEKAEAELLRTQQRTRALEFELDDHGNIRRELVAKQAEVLTFHDRSKEFDALLQQRDELRNDLEVANMRLKSRELDRERSIQAYERRIMDLEARLQIAERRPSQSGQLPASVQQMLDSALAANNAKLQQLKKIHHRLLERHTELEMKYHELEGERQAERGRYPSPEKYSYSSPEKESITRNYSFRQASQDSKYLSPLSTEQTNEEYSHYGDYHSPASVNSPSGQSSSVHSPHSTSSPANRPVRLESLHSKRSPTAPMPFGRSFSANYDTSLDAHFQAAGAANAANATDTVTPSSKSALSDSTNDSRSDSKKDKVAPKSDVRVYGRGDSPSSYLALFPWAAADSGIGGAQNIGKKVKEKDEDRKKEKEMKKGGKTGGFRGLKGIM